jgi:hypothetical protein
VSTHTDKVVMFTINATWLRRHPTYSVYYVMVSCEFVNCLTYFKIGNFFFMSLIPVNCLTYFKIGNFFFMSLIPVILLTTLNYLIYRGVHRLEQNQMPKEKCWMILLEPQSIITQYRATTEETTRWPPSSPP